MGHGSLKIRVTGTAEKTGDNGQQQSSPRITARPGLATFSFRGCPSKEIVLCGQVDPRLSDGEVFHGVAVPWLTGCPSPYRRSRDRTASSYQNSRRSTSTDQRPLSWLPKIQILTHKHPRYGPLYLQFHPLVFWCPVVSRLISAKLIAVLM